MAPIEMQHSIISVVFDLLEFEGQGNFRHFDRSFRKACVFLSLVADDAAFRKLRNLAFWYLRNTGYLDVSYTPTATTWSTAPPNLVQRGERDFILVAGSKSAAAVRAAAADSAREERSPDNDLQLGPIPFFPSALCLNISLPEARELCGRTNISLSPAYQLQLLQHLPSVDSVLRDALEEEDECAQFEPDSAERFDFASCTWERFSDTRVVKEGLYRQSFDHRSPAYTIAAPSVQKRLTMFRVMERDWVLPAALVLLRKTLPIRYEKSSHKLSISRRYSASLRLPTLIERCLRSGTLLNPAVSREWFIYDGIRSSSVAQLTTKLPIFNAEGRL